MYVEGINPALTYSVNITTNPEFPNPPFAVGTRGLDQLGREWVFCSNTTTAALVAGDVVTLSTGFAATQITTSNGARGLYVGVVPVAVAQSTSSTTYYFWAQRYGTAYAGVKALASAVANVRLNTVATAAALDDDGTVSTKQVQGIYLTTTNGGSVAVTPAILTYPFVDATL